MRQWPYSVEALSNPVVPVGLLAHVKSVLRIDHNELDATLNVHVASAWSELDDLNGTLGRSLTRRQWRAKAAPGPAIRRLVLPDVVSVDAFAYMDASTGAWTALTNDELALLRYDANASDLYVDTSAVRGYVAESWRLTVTAGPAAVPSLALDAAACRTQLIYEGPSPQWQALYEHHLARLRLNPGG